jgi:hypothetical protein
LAILRSPALSPHNLFCGKYFGAIFAVARSEIITRRWILPIFPDTTLILVYSSAATANGTPQNPASFYPAGLVLDNEIGSVNLTDLACDAGIGNPDRQWCAGLSAHRRKVHGTLTEGPAPFCRPSRSGMETELDGMVA